MLCSVGAQPERHWNQSGTGTRAALEPEWHWCQRRWKLQREVSGLCCERSPPVSCCGVTSSGRCLERPWDPPAAAAFPALTCAAFSINLCIPRETDLLGPSQNHLHTVAIPALFSHLPLGEQGGRREKLLKPKLQLRANGLMVISPRLYRFCLETGGSAEGPWPWLRKNEH